MSRLDRLTDDYARDPVPIREGVSGFRIAMVIVGFAITLPLMITGSQMGLTLGIRDAFIAFAAGGLILTVLGSLTAMVAADARLSTYKILEFSFGRLGAKLVSTLLAMTLFGWYGVTAALFGEALQTALLDIYGLELSATAGVIVGSLLMIAVTLFGFKALDLLSLIAVPLLLLFLSTLVVHSIGSVESHTQFKEDSADFGVSISMVVGTYIVGVVLVPDLCRYAKSLRDGVLAIILSLGIGLPFILGASAVPSIAAGEANLVAIMVQLGFGIPALFVIVFATWTSNANNLYSTSLGLAAVIERTAKWKITVAAGVVGTLVAVAGITQYFMPFLLVLGVAIPPVAGVYLCDYFLVRGRADYIGQDSSLIPRVSVAAFAAWIIASTIGILTVRGWITLTGIPACDSFLSAAILYYSINKLSRTRANHRGVESHPP